MEKEEYPWYIQHWIEVPNENTQKIMDDEAKEFVKTFYPLYRKHVGTKKLLKDIKDYLATHDIKRKEDFKIQLVCMWCDHIHYYRDLHGIEFKAEDVFKIKIPDVIKNIY